MSELRNLSQYQLLNNAYATVFKPKRISLGLVVPVEAYPNGPVASMEAHLQRVQLAESLGFSAVWLRDVPFNVPRFGDAGQPFDPFVYLGFLAAHTQRIALGIASVVLPLRHPAHVARAAASIDQLSNGRLLLGVASGDRPEEFPALQKSYPDRGERFRNALAYLSAMANTNPHIDNPYGKISGQMDMLPKPYAGKLPLFITGASQQSMDWNAQYADGWMTYPKGIEEQAVVVARWQNAVARAGELAKPVMQPLYIDIDANPNKKPEAMHLGFRSGIKYLKDYVTSLQAIGIGHLALNLRFNRGDIDDTLRQLAQELLPEFS